MKPARLFALRVLTLASVPTALLIGVSVSASADESGLQAPTSARSTLHEPELARDEVLTTRQQEGSTTARAAQGWHWMGNYGDVYALVNTANARGVGPGQLVTQHMSNGLLATFMYY